jgi:hypothetical protein
VGRTRQAGCLTGSAERPVSTLKDIGVTKSQSSRWQQKSALPKDEQEALTSASGAKGVTVKNDSRPQ